MRKDEIEASLREIEIEKRVEKRVKYHCVAFWSGMMGFFALLGSWISDNSIAFKAAVKTFIEIWMQK
jgi:hypothetical protein